MRKYKPSAAALRSFSGRGWISFVYSVYLLPPVISPRPDAMELTARKRKAEENFDQGCCMDLNPQTYCLKPFAWTWDEKRRSCDSRILPDKKTVVIHPVFSLGTSAMRATRAINNSVTYWEVEWTLGILGSSVMFGVGTNGAALGRNQFVNLLGETASSWGLNHCGFIWHDGRSTKFTDQFHNRFPILIGMLYDGYTGSLTYYKDGKCLGVAFVDLDYVKEPIYPMISSTSARTVMTVRSCRSMVLRLGDIAQKVLASKVPKQLIKYLKAPSSVKERLEGVIDRRHECSINWKCSCWRLSVHD